MLRILAIIAPSIAESISASSNTIKGALPPSSIAGLTTQSVASCKSLRPTSVEPVNDTTRTRGSCSMVLTTLPDERDGMTLTMPRGTPASSRIGISASMVSGVSGAGLGTTAQRGADLARRQGGWKIPRRHLHGDAGRLVLHEDARAGGGRAGVLADIAHGL